MLDLYPDSSYIFYMATVDQSSKTEFTMVNADTHFIDVRKTGYYRLRIGTGGTPDFGSGPTKTIAVQQDGDDLNGLGAVGSYTDKIVHLIGGKQLQLVPSGALVSVTIFLVKELPAHAK